jgi:protein SCO1/2
MKRMTMAAAAAFFLVAGCGGEPATPLPAQGIIALSDQFAADFALLDKDGKVMRDEDLKGRVGFVYFGFATCPDVCPMAVGRMVGALNELTDKEREKVVPLFITVDPDRDTPEALGKYLGAIDPRLIGLSGDRMAIEQAKAGFKVFAEPETVADSKIGYTMQHSSLFYIIDKSGKLTTALEDTLTPAEIAAALRRAL